jgi:putative DNA primase/helicase
MNGLEMLAAEPRWVGWRNEERGNKLTKVPYSTVGKKAKADDPSTWRSRTEAESVAAQIVNGLGGGVGIELGDLGGDLYLGGVYLDSCVDLEQKCLTGWAEEILDAMPTYAEVSPSGKGVKAFFYCAAEDVRRFLDAIGVDGDKWGTKRGVEDQGGADHGPGIEVYLSHRYFTVTEWLVPNQPDRIQTLNWDALQQLARLIPKVQKTGEGHAGRDGSRSAIALRKGAALRRAGKTFEEMCEALRSDPETADWCREKGDASGMRELHRIWNRAASNAVAPEFSDEALALEFTAIHAADLRYLALLGKWVMWTQTHWLFEETLKAFDLSRTVCRKASTRVPPKNKKPAADVASAKKVAAVERLAKADRRHSTALEDWDPNFWMFNKGE